MQRTPNAVKTQAPPPDQPAVPPVGPQVIDPSLYKFIAGGLPREGGWAVATTPVAATTTGALA